MFSNLVWATVEDQFIQATIAHDGRCVSKDGKVIQSTQPLLERTDAVVEDMINLPVLNDPQLLYNINSRYYEDAIFTYVGPTLLVVNPFKAMPREIEFRRMYIEQVIAKKKPYKELQPHTFAVTAHAFTQLGEKNQAIVISGESGAGKTENARYCMNLLTSINSEDDQLSSKIIGCNPILEAFGNAKTVRNKNSSRFGKYSRLMVSNQNIVGADIVNYLLEKSRVITQPKNNRNFHIFYHFLFGTQNLDTYRIRQKEFRYLPKSDYQFSQATYNELIEAFSTVGMQVERVFQIVAAVLLIGELDFDDATYDNNTPCILKPQEILKDVCDLLQIEPDAITKALTYKMAVYGKEKILSPLKKQDCLHIRDSWAKEIYETLFSWIVGQLNQTLEGQRSQTYIGLLDIYGFEVFDDGNGFEQMIINYSNERLHQLYIDYVFKEERKIFVNEGLGDQVGKIQFNDNSSIIDLFDKPPVCVFNLLDQACKLNQSDAQLLTSLRKELKFPQSMKPVFTIKHTAKNVEYTCKEFVEKNMDEIPALLLNVVSKSEMVKFEAKPKSICLKIKKEMKELMTELSDCGVHFIRCIKPNDDLVPDKLDGPFAMRQIRYLGVLDSLKVRKESFPIRVAYQRFYKKYGEFTQQDNWRQLVEKLLQETFKVNPELYLFGQTQLFMQEKCLKDLDTLYRERMKQKIQMAIKIQRGYRSYKMRKCYKLFMARIKRVTSRIMRIKRRNEFRKRVKAANLIKKYFQEYKVQKKIKQYKKQITLIQQVVLNYVMRCQWKQKLVCLVKIQKAAKSHLLRQRIKRNIVVKSALQGILERAWDVVRNRAAVVIQKYIRGFLTRKHHQKEIKKIEEVGRQIRFQKKVKTIQKWARGYIVRCRLAKMHSAAYLIQGYFRMRCLSDIFQRMRMAAVYIQRRWRQTIPKRRLLKQQYSVYIQPMEQQLQYQKILEEEHLFSNNEYDFYLHAGFESLVTPKIYLFAFLLDLEVLQDTSDCYSPSFAARYKDLFLSQFQKERPIDFISIGDTFAFATAGNKLFGWGLNDLSQLGFLSDGEIHPPTNLQIPGKFKQLSLGSNHAQLLMYDDKSYFWGCVSNKTVSHPTLLSEGVTYLKSFRDKFYYIKNGVFHDNVRKVPNLPIITKLSCGAGFVMLVTENGLLYAVGSNERGQLGLGDRTPREEPVRVQFQEKVLQVECGLKHVILLTSLKKVFAWGWGEHGQLGNGSLSDQLSPCNLQIFADQVMAGSRSSSLFTKQLFWCGTNGTINKKYYFEPVVLKCTQLSRKEYTPIRILSSFSKNMCLTWATYACHKGVFENNQAKALKICHTLTSKWVEQNIWSVDPPYVESIASYFCERHQVKMSQAHQKQRTDEEAFLKKQRIQQLGKIPRSKWTKDDLQFILKLQ